MFQDSRENKTNQFPEGPYIKCFVIYLDFPLNDHIAKKNKPRRHNFFIRNRQSSWREHVLRITLFLI